MSNQYFENNPNLEHHEYSFSFYYLNELFNFKSDNGVFSKKQIDFGTNLLLKNINLKQMPNVKKALDVGCGIGIIGLSIAKSNPNSFVDLVDINKKAILLSQQNALINHITNVRILESNLYANIQDHDYDLIVSNPPIRAGKKIVHEIVTQGYQHLKEDGLMMGVIQEKQGAKSLIKIMEPLFLKVEIIDNNKGYLIIKASK